jgi:hypothetical protein
MAMHTATYRPVNHCTTLAIVQWDRPNGYNYKVKQRIFLVDRMETAIKLKPKNDDTDVTFETQFELVSVWKIVVGIFTRMGEKQVRRNFTVAKQILEAG